jgi:hypothetical protein
LLEQELPNDAHNGTAAEKSQFNIRWKVTVVAAPLCQRRELTEKEQQFVQQFVFSQLTVLKQFVFSQLTVLTERCRISRLTA